MFIQTEPHVDDVGHIGRMIVIYNASLHFPSILHRLPMHAPRHIIYFADLYPQFFPRLSSSSSSSPSSSPSSLPTIPSVPSLTATSSLSSQLSRRLSVLSSLSPLLRSSHQRAYPQALSLMDSLIDDLTRIGKLGNFLFFLHFFIPDPLHSSNFNQIGTGSMMNR
jgi:hypothetical protein